MTYMELDNVSLRFRVRRRGKVSLKEYILKRMFRKSVNPVMEVRAQPGLPQTQSPRTLRHHRT